MHTFIPLEHLAGVNRRQLTSKDYTFKSLGGQPYRINVCAPVVSEIWAPKVDKPEEIAAVTRRQHGDFSIGWV